MRKFALILLFALSITTNVIEAQEEKSDLSLIKKITHEEE
jgi:hypothetical protein